MKYFICLLLSLCCQQAFAIKTYLGTSYLILNYDEQGLSESYTPAMGAVFAGLRVSEHFAFEALYAANAKGDARNESLNNEEKHIEIAFAGLAQGRALFLIPVDLVAQFYTFAAFTQFDMDVTTTVNSVAETKTSSGSDVGFGGGLRFGNNWLKGHLEYGKWYNQKLDNTRIKLDGINLGVSFHF